MKFKNKIYVTYEDYMSLIKDLEFEVMKLKPELLVGITRGGLVPTVHLSHALNVPMETIAWSTRDGDKNEMNQNVVDAIAEHKTVVFVDDINDTGKTFEAIREAYQPGARLNTFFVSLLEKTDSEFLVDASCLSINDPRWIVFPWEKD